MRDDIITRMSEELRKLRSRWIGLIDKEHGERIVEDLTQSYNSWLHTVGDGQVIKSSNWNSMSKEVVSDLVVIEQGILRILDDIEKSRTMVVAGDTGLPALLGDLRSDKERNKILEDKIEGCSACKVYRFVQPASRAISPGNEDVGDMYTDWSSGESFGQLDLCGVLPSLDGEGVVTLPTYDSDDQPIASVREVNGTETTPGDISVDNYGNIMNTCDEYQGSFWIKRVANKVPIVKCGDVSCVLLSKGIGLPDPGQYAFNTLFTRSSNNLRGHYTLGLPRPIIVRVLTGGTINSGDVTFVSYHRGYIAQPLRCISDGGMKCLLGLKEFHNTKCMNTSCPMYKAPSVIRVTDGNTFYPLYDGYGRECGYKIRFNNDTLTEDTYIPPGMTWLIETGIDSSGAVIELDCELPAVGMHDYITISPVGGGFIIDEMILYKKNEPNTLTSDVSYYVPLRNKRINRVTRVWIQERDDYRRMLLRIRQDRYEITACDPTQESVTDIIKDTYLDGVSKNELARVVSRKATGLPIEKNIVMEDVDQKTTGYVYEFGIRELRVGKLSFLPRGMRVLQPLKCGPVGEIRMEAEMDTPQGMITSSLYDHASGVSLELAVRIVLLSQQGKAYRNIDVPFPYKQYFTMEGITNASTYYGIAGERLFNEEGIASLRFPVSTPSYMIDNIDELDEETSANGLVSAVTDTTKRIQITTIQSPDMLWDVDEYVGYDVLIDGSTKKNYEIISNDSGSLVFYDPQNSVEVGGTHLFRIGTITSTRQAVNGNIVCYDISKARFLYPEEVALSIDRSGRAPVTKVELANHLWGDVICASYIPDTKAVLTQDGVASLGSDRIFVEDISDASSANIYPALLLRGNPITNDATMMVRKITLFVSEYER